MRVSGERIFHVGRHGSHQKGNPRSGVPLISVHIMISLLVISRIIFYRKHFWPPGSLFFSDGGSRRLTSSKNGHFDLIVYFLLTFLCRCRRPPFSVKFLNLNFGGNGDFLDFLFQDTFNAVLLRYLSDVVGASCWFKK